MQNQRGFTGIELMVAMAILGILVVLGIGLMGPQMAHFRLNTAAREMISTLRSTAQMAVTQNANRTVTFTDNVSPTPDRYTLGGATPVTRDLPLGISYGVSGAGAPANGTADVAAAPIPADGITFTGNAVTFQTNRTPGQAGEIYLTNSRGENIAISVNAIGRIRCWRWGGAAWQGC
jgi:prepilin-type N-terminal cleavage/methylation domain-containing protein